MRRFFRSHQRHKTALILFMLMLVAHAFVRRQDIFACKEFEQLHAARR
jgi:hypothetical protein